MTQPPDGSGPRPEDATGPPEEATPSRDQPTVAWQPPGPDQPTVAWAPPPDAPKAGPIISASPTGLGPPPAQGTPGDQPVSGWVMPDAGLPPAPVAGYVFGGVGARLVGILLDWLLLTILAFVIWLVIVIAAGDALLDDPVASGALLAVTFTGLEFLYFVGFWTSGRRATPGMRVLGLAVVTPVDGGRIGITAAVIRWFLLTMPIGNIGTLLPVGSEAVSGLALLWWIVLLITTAVDPARRGLHDRWSGTAVIRGAGASGAAVAIGCVALIVILTVASVIGLIYLGSQVETILSDAGQPI